MNDSAATALASLVWPLEQLEEGFERLRHSLRLPGRSIAVAPLPELDELEEAVRRGGSRAGFTLQEISARGASLAHTLRDSAPAVVVLAGRPALLRRVRRGRAEFLAPDGRRHWVPLTGLCDVLLRGPAGERPARAVGLDADLERRLAEAAEADLELVAGWALTAEQGAPAASLVQALRPLAWRFTGVLLLHAVQYTLWVGSWIAFVAMAMQLDGGGALLGLWLLALVSSVLMLPLETAWQEDLARRLGLRIKQLLMHRALHTDREQVREAGLGQLLARSLEANQLDVLASQGGISVLLAGLELLLALVLVCWWQGVSVLAVGFIAALGVLGWLGTRFFQAVDGWREAARHVAAIHTEAMVGHRARKALLGRGAWHEAEDQALVAYFEQSRQLDEIALWLGTLHRWWGVAGVGLVLVTLLLDAGAGQPAQAAALVGFVILTHAALHVAATGAARLLQALVLARRFELTAPEPLIPGADPGRPSPDWRSQEAVSLPRLDRRSSAAGELVAEGLRYTYPHAAEPVLADCRLRLQPGDRLLLTGASGSGKSTLGGILSGRLTPTAGAVLSHGVDRHVVGLDYWRHLVSYVPQANVNHLVTDSLAFNLLMGRRWPARRQDLADAQTLARELGLGPLLDRMPAGIMQVVGESGWRLSQGEQVRVFACRALLQGSSTIILDELLGPLDPQTAREVLRAVDRRADKLVLVAHL